MPDIPSPEDMKALWREQPLDPRPVLPAHFLQRRAGQLSASTRGEILTSLGAALLFMLLLAWRVQLLTDRLILAGFALTTAWLLLTLYWYRKRIWIDASSREAALTAPSLDFYRAELQRRREHLHNLWIWHGPLFLACLTLAAVAARNASPSLRRLYFVLPLLLLLAIWTGLGIRQRRRQAADMQQEIDELNNQ